jgi:DNA-binding CsgD family transcriptional regulator
MKLWQRLLALFRMMRPRPERRYFELDAPLQAALQERAGREQRPLEQFQAELLAAGLANLQTSDELKRCWERLSGREQEVTALTCLGYTNRQMAARMGVSPDTVKGYMRQVLIKFHAHSKQELRLSLAQWDFSAWGTPQE